MTTSGRQVDKKTTPSPSDNNQKNAKVLQQIISWQAQIQEEVSKVTKIISENEVITKVFKGKYKP